LESRKPGEKLRNLLILGCFLLVPLVSRAEEQTTEFQASLFYPAQLHPADYSIDDGLRLNLIYGVNENVRGIDIGIVNKANGDAGGFELGMVNEVKMNFQGVQIGLIANVTRHSCQGFQAGVYNDAEEDMRGLQLGIVNHAGSLNGIQIGILNFNDDTKYLGFFPFINAAF
jgi:hypothetical protein